MSEVLWPMVAAFGILMATLLIQMHVPAKRALEELQKQVVSMEVKLNAATAASIELVKRTNDAEKLKDAAIKELVELKGRIAKLELRGIARTG